MMGRSVFLVVFIFFWAGTSSLRGDQDASGFEDREVIDVLHGREVSKDLLKRIFNSYLTYIEGDAFAADLQCRLVFVDGNEKASEEWREFCLAIDPKSGSYRVQTFDLEDPDDTDAQTEEDAIDISGAIVLREEDHWIVRDLGTGNIQKVPSYRMAFRLDGFVDLRAAPLLMAGAWLVGVPPVEKLVGKFLSPEVDGNFQIDRIVLFDDESCRIDYIALDGDDGGGFRHSLFFDYKVGGMPSKMETRLLHKFASPDDPDLEKAATLVGKPINETTVQWEKKNEGATISGSEKWEIASVNAKYRQSNGPKRARHTVTVSVAVSEYFYGSIKDDVFTKKSLLEVYDANQLVK